MRKLSERLHSGERGFSLIEVLVVVIVIGILVAIALPAFLSQRQKGQDANAKSNARNVVSALEACYTNAQSYTNCNVSQDVKASGIPTGSGKGQVSLASLQVDNYQVVGNSESGNKFTITSPSSGPRTRTCSAKDTGGCPSSGGW